MLEKGDNMVAVVVARRLSIAPGTYLSSEDVLVATKNLQVKMQNSLSVGDYLRIMIYFVVQFSWGLVLRFSKILGSIIQVKFTKISRNHLKVPRSDPEPISLHLLYAYFYAIHTYSANTLFQHALVVSPSAIDGPYTSATPSPIH
jgi:hypothetical protein